MPGAALIPHFDGSQLDPLHGFGAGKIGLARLASRNLEAGSPFKSQSIRNRLAGRTGCTMAKLTRLRHDTRGRRDKYAFHPEHAPTLMTA